MQGGCTGTSLGQFRGRTYRFRQAPMYPFDQPLALSDGRSVDRNPDGSIEWESTLEHSERVRVGSASAVLLKIFANHVGGTGSIAYVLVIRCRPRKLEVVFEASGPNKDVSYSKNGVLSLSHGVWSRDDSHASPSRESTERYKWVPE